MPIPDASPSPTPPVIGFYGSPLTPQKGEGTFKEQTPEGGYILWKKSVNGDWRPFDYYEPPSPQPGIES